MHLYLWCTFKTDHHPLVFKDYLFSSKNRLYFASGTPFLATIAVGADESFKTNELKPPN